MPRKSKIERDRETEADELLLRALRQLADEALVEEVPERLLRPLREAQNRQRIERAAGEDGAQESSDRDPDSRRRAGSS